MTNYLINLLITLIEQRKLDPLGAHSWFGWAEIWYLVVFRHEERDDVGKFIINWLINYFN